MKIYITALLIALVTAILTAQDFSGEWTGKLQQTGKPGVFEYQVSLSRQGNSNTGSASTRSTDGTFARFEIGGVWDGRQLSLQEVDQLEPAGARWCLKHIRLKPLATDYSRLEGEWEAQGCTPGTLLLCRPGTDDAETPPQAIPDIPAPVSFAGKWTGRLSQSDRDYGFYFEMRFHADGTGTSLINSDSEGGSATHQFNWSFDEQDSLLRFSETSILEETLPEWRWCMKSGPLRLKKEKHRLSLAGPWSGFIEGYTPDSGPCASGELYVEQPVFSQEDLAPAKVVTKGAPAVAAPPVPAGVADYESTQGRKAEVGQVLEVKNKTIRIRVWDNGTVDGDVCTLFLNGKIILEKYRVVRSKHETIVKLDKPMNYLILHAISLGNIHPNTVAVSVDDGVKEQVVIVSSNLKSSGAIMIREFTVN